MALLSVLTLIVACFQLVLAVTSSSSFNWPLLSKYDHFSKRLTTALRAGGRLENRQISYLQQAGFASILSIVNFTTTDESFKGIVGDWPSSAEEQYLAKSYGLEMEYFASTLTVASVDFASDLIQRLPKPVFVHCHVGWTASLFTQLHLVRTGVILAEDIYNNSLTLGWDYQSNADAVSLIEAYTGLHSEVVSEQIEKSLTDGEMSYKNYYWSHRLENDNWFNQGQPLDTHVDAIQAAGYKTVISFRANGEPTTRLPTDNPTGAINNHEFSDSNGNYDVKAEETAFTSAGVLFFNLPVSGSEAWSVKQFESYKPVIESASANGPVLAHCTSGYRSAGYIIAYLALEKGECTPWALKEARRVGYSYDQNEEDEKVVSFFQSILAC